MPQSEIGSKGFCASHNNKNTLAKEFNKNNQAIVFQIKFYKKLNRFLN